MMYGSEETPRRCPKCGFIRTRVEQAYRTGKHNKRRIRICLNEKCGNRFVTNEEIDIRFI